MASVGIRLLVTALLLCIVANSFQQESSALLETYKHAENLFETSQSLLSVRTTSNTQRIMVHVKIHDHVLLNDDFLNRMAELMQVDNYKEFQFHSEIPVFTTRLTIQQINELSSNYLAKRSIEWIKKVSNADKLSFAKLTLDSLKIGGLKIIFDSKLNEMQRLETMNRMRNWYISSYSSKMIRALSKVNIQQIQQTLKSTPLSEFGLNSLPQELDESFVRDFITTQADSLFNLQWNIESNDVQIKLANFEYGVWRLLKQRKFDHPTVQSLKRREQVQKFFQQNQELEGLMEEMSNEMGQMLLNYLSNDESVDLVTRDQIMEIKNYGANQVIQNGGGSSYTYMWDNGITGASEVVSVLDTGLTLGHCFFSATGESTTKTTVNLSSRKVVYYGQNGAGTDLVDDEGHGTHVAGTIAGYPETLGSTTTDKNVGVAKEAKLYAVDLQKGTGGLNVGDIGAVFKTALTSAGSRISSNSWGCSNPYECDYDCNCYSVNNDNSRTPVADATCIAATGTRCCHYCNRYGLNSVRADTFLNSNDEATVVFAAGNDGTYSADSNLGDPATAKNVLSVGASYAPSSYYKQFFSAKNYTVYEYENMASFSSRGPTYDKRIKPDIVSPGYDTVSSLNTASCNWKSISGTSMATPSVSGAAALVRHYLLKDNKKKLVDYNIYDRSTSQTLSGTLVKAMILHSGEEMKGFVKSGGKDLYLSQFKSPNNYNGFGRINLQNILKIDTDSSSVNRVKNVLLANRYSLDANQQLNILMKANSITTLKVTLTWYDLPSASDTPSTVKNKKLINDIDLAVVIGGNTYFGNGAINGNTIDSLNTVESLTISNLAQGNFTIKVSSKINNKGKQPFSMVITGDVSIREQPADPIALSSARINTDDSKIIGQSATIEYSFTLLIVLLIIYFIQY